MTGPRCAARPADLWTAAGDLDRVASSLHHAVAAFDGVVDLALASTGGVFAALRWSDPLLRIVAEADDLATWVRQVGDAFAAAGGAHGSDGIVMTDPGAVDGWQRAASWLPGDHLVAGGPGEWAAAVFGARCLSWATAGYTGRGFVVGPDGRRYPLVAPHVVRDGVTYHANDGVAPGRPAVADLDGRDPGWVTLCERIGVERWRDAPSPLERVLIGIGSTAAGVPIGSTARDVMLVVLAPGRAPTLANAPPAPATPVASPPVYTPPAPDHPPPAAPDVMYPLGQGSLSAGAIGVAPVVVDGVAGAAAADRGSFDAYDVAFQQNADGRIRALYRRVFVGFDDDGEPVLTSVYVTGPDRNDQVAITYAPPD